MAGQRQTGGRTRALFFLGISAVAAVMAALVVYRIIHNYQEQLESAQQPEVTTPVVVAGRTLYQGETLAATDLVLKDMPPAFVPETVFHSLEEVVGRVPAERILEGEYVRKERLADPEAGIGLNAIIPRGMRAISLNITDGSAVSGFLNPSNYVDVLCTITPVEKNGTAQKPVTITMLQARKVLAVNSRMGADDGGPDGGNAGYAPSVTLAVTPDEAEKITHARLQGAVALTLRNDVDVTQVHVEGTHVDKLIGRADAPAQKVEVQRKAAAAPVAPTPKNNDLTIIHGGSEEKVKVDANGQTH